MFDNIYNENMTNNKKYESKGISDTTLESNSYIINANLETPKKKKKHDRSSVESTSNYSTNSMGCKKPVEEFISCIKDNSSNEGLIKKKKHKHKEISDTTLESKSYMINENLKTPKKKKNHDRSLIESISNYRTNVKIFEKPDEEFNDHTNDNSFNESIIKKKKEKNKEILGTIVESNSYIINGNLETPNKKKKYDRSSVESTSNYSTNSMGCKKPIEDFISCIKDNSSNEGLIKKKKHKHKEISDTTLESNSYMINENLKTPKKKKNHDRNSVESTSNYSTNSMVCKKPVEEFTSYIKDSSSNEGLIKKKKHKHKEILDTTLESNCYIINEKLETPKKMKKHNRSSIESTSNYSKKEKIFEKPDEEFTAHTNDNSFNESIVKKKKEKNKEILGTIVESNSYITNGILETPKKKKKHDRSSVESTSNYSTNSMGCKKPVEEFISCIKDNSSNEGLIKKKKHKHKEMSDTTLESNSYITNGILETPKKKKKHDRSSVESTSNYSTNSMGCKKPEEEFTDHTNDNSFNESIIKKKKEKNKEILGTTVESNSYIINENLETPKRKKNHDRNSVESTSNYSTYSMGCKKPVEEFISCIKDNSSNEGLIKKKKHKHKEISDTTLESYSYITNGILETPEKKKKHDRSSVESTSNYSTNSMGCKKPEEEFTDHTNDNSFNENIIKNKKPKNIEISDTTFESNSYKINENLETPKKKKKCDMSSIESTSNYSLNVEIFKKSKEEFIDHTNDNSFLRTKRKHIKSIPGSDSDESAVSKKNKNEFNIINIVTNIQSLQQNLVESDKFTEPENIDDTLSNNINELTANSNNLNADNKVLKKILNEIHKSKSTPTTENNVNLDDFDLIKHVISLNSSIKDHENFFVIKKKFSRFINESFNLKGQMVTPSDIVLLKVIGIFILENIIDVYNKTEEIIKIISHIELPPECQNIKMHFVETKLSSRIDKNKLILIKKLNPAVKFGIFSEEEDISIRKYWLKFKQEYNISDVHPFLTVEGIRLSLPMNIKLPFVRYISGGLPNRLLLSVYHRFNVLYKQVNELSFSKEEDELIMIINKCDTIKNKLSLLSIILNRSRGQIFRRINTFKMEPLRGEKYISWDTDKLQKLFVNILLETNTKNWEDLKKIKIKPETWKKISNRFDEPINYEKCQSQWFFLKTRLFCEKLPIKYSKLKLIILEKLVKINPKNWSDIKWGELTKKLFPGANAKVICTIFRWWITHKVPVEYRGNVKESLKFLSTNCLDTEVEKVTEGKERIFSKLTVKSGNVLEVKTE